MVAVSKSNRRVRELRKLIRRGSYRDEMQVYVIDGSGLLREAALTGNVPIDIFVADNDSDMASEVSELVSAGSTVWDLEEKVLRSVASTQNPQSVVATVPMVEYSLDDILESSPSFLVIGVEINDPGNAGTIIRTAAASGADAVIFSHGSVDVYNPKVVRASAGGIFRIPVIRSMDIADLLRSCEKNGITPLGLAGEGQIEYSTYNFDHPIALLVGNEVRGLDRSVVGNLEAQISIPMEAGVESLNAAVALAIVSFEVHRQRNLNDV